jgi:SAM-dependent methyltransferase
MSEIYRRYYPRRSTAWLPLAARLAYRRCKTTVVRLSGGLQRYAHDTWYERRYTGVIDMDTVLIGGDSRFSKRQMQSSVHAIRTSVQTLDQSPHVDLLRCYERDGDRLFDPAAFVSTSYYRYADECEAVTGHNFFGQRELNGYIAQARAFARLYDRVREGDKEEVEFPSRQGHSARGSLPIVERTWTPGVYQVVNGHHRLAIAHMLGHRRVRAVVLPPRPTELQYLVATCAQPRGSRELYQPIDAPDFNASWPILRRCTDRFALMTQFLDSQGIQLPDLSVRDLACSYGWFAQAFARQGCRVLGVEHNELSLRIGHIAYGLQDQQTLQADLVDFLEADRASADVTLLLSILHHFVMRPDRLSPEALLRLVDRATAKVLFLDMGQEHETWFRRALAGWDDERIVAFIRANTTFTRILKIGVDSDGDGRFAGNYGRSLFACIRS